PVTAVNGNAARSYGVELAAKWEPTTYWTLDASYTYLDFKRQRPEALAFTVANASPPQQASLRSSLLLPNDLEVDNSVYVVDELKNQNISGYIRFDTRLAWKPMENLELSLVAQNIFDDAHTEFTGFTYQQTSQVPRSIYGNVTWKF
ncbi:MAG: TonB-dependent receptor, partial [Rickettsiales bacterium]|nr:TonB-dependent receptor [Rickettsiales bacterium]